jgi:hypothetical protein
VAQAVLDARAVGRTRSSLVVIPVVYLLLEGCGPGADPRWGQGAPDAPPGSGAPPNNTSYNREVCDNGEDDDGDGDVDEECACTPGMTQACWPDEPGTRGVGACRDGMQTCVASESEFSTWGPCQGADLPTPDRSMDGIDQDCSGEDGAPSCAARETACSGGGDEDCDGLRDCTDPDCAMAQGCVPVTCTNECIPGFVRWCDTPIDCAWGRQTCTPSGTWGACIEVGAPPGCEWTDDEYDTGCCNSLPDACCQNYPDDDSIGECAGNGNCP